MFDLLFITTFIHTNAIKELMSSLVCNKSIKLCVVVVAQNNLDIDTTSYETSNVDVLVIKIQNQVNSSVARNIGVDFVLENNIKSKFVMFPDDDSSFDNYFFDNFNGLVNNKYCYLTDVYETGTKEYFQHIRVKKGSCIDKSYWNSVGAVNFILNYEKFVLVGRFDENMGAAAKYGAGEDSDYFIRSLYNNASYDYVKDIYSYHPSGRNRYKSMTYRQLLDRFKNYGQGVVYLLIKHKMYFQAVKISFKALGGCVLCLAKLDFKMSYVYLYAFFCRTRIFIELILRRNNDNS